MLVNTFTLAWLTGKGERAIDQPKNAEVILGGYKKTKYSLFRNETESKFIAVTFGDTLVIWTLLCAMLTLSSVAFLHELRGKVIHWLRNKAKEFWSSCRAKIETAWVVLGKACSRPTTISRGRTLILAPKEIVIVRPSSRLEK